MKLRIGCTGKAYGANAPKKFNIEMLVKKLLSIEKVEFFIIKSTPTDFKRNDI
jgi:hypothetical protein